MSSLEMDLAVCAESSSQDSETFLVYVNMILWSLI